MLHRTRTLGLVMAGLASLVALAPVTAAAADCGGNTPCACGDNVVADRKLTKGQDPVMQVTCTGHGLILNTAGVAIELSKGEIKGDRSPADVGILIQADGVTIQGPGSIVNFGTGIAGTTSGSTIELVKIAKSRGDGLSLTGDTNTIFDNQTSSNGATGIVVAGDGNIVEANRSALNADDGIRVVGDNNEVIGKNAGSKSGGVGIKVVGNNNTVVQNHQTHHNQSHGIRVVGSGNCIGNNATTRNKALDILASATEGDPNSDGNNIDGGRNNFNQVDEAAPQISKNCMIDGQACQFNAPACP